MGRACREARLLRQMSADLDRPVFVVDLREAALAEDRAALERNEQAPPLAPDEPLDAEEAIDTIAVLHDESETALLLPIEPTRDRRLLDAIARLLRFAVLHGKRMPEIAVLYGNEYERTLAFARQLPRWAYDGVDVTLPVVLRRTLRTK